MDRAIQMLQARLRVSERLIQEYTREAKRYREVETEYFVNLADRLMKRVETLELESRDIQALLDRAIPWQEENKRETE